MRQGASRNVGRKRRPQFAKDGRGAGTVDDIILIKLGKDTEGFGTSAQRHQTVASYHLFWLRCISRFAKLL